MKKGHFTKIAASALVLATLASGAAAKDWIEHFSYAPSGIDAEKIYVVATKDGYTTTTTSSKLFRLRTHAKAKSGKRITGLRVEAGSVANYIQSPGGSWFYEYSYAEVGKGRAREKVWDHGYPLSLLDVEWHSRNPVQVCNHNLALKVADGWSKEQVLAQKWSLNTKAAFSASVVVTKAMNTTPNPEKLKQFRRDIEGDIALYPVAVECLAAPGMHNTIAPPVSNEMTLLVPRDRDDDSDRPARRPNDDDRPDTRDGGGSPPARDDSGRPDTRDGGGSPPARDPYDNEPELDVSR